MSFGFIMTRHVNTEKTNRYWNQSVKLIRTHYPKNKIVIIDDNSNEQYVKADYDYNNIEIINTEYPSRGELLPYIYYLKYKWFDNAIILHDSVFIHKRINFDNIKQPVLPLWHRAYDRDNLYNLIRIASHLKNFQTIKQKLSHNEINILGMSKEKLNLCFGGQAFININFLMHIENKYNISNLVNVIHCRKDRCGLERIMGLIFCLENPNLLKVGSLFGDIFSHYNCFRYTYDNYIYDFRTHKIHGLFVKVWTGR
jgi:hypothetical protein